MGILPYWLARHFYFSTCTGCQWCDVAKGLTATNRRTTSETSARLLA